MLLNPEGMKSKIHIKRENFSLADRRREAGFTMIEILIALSIFSASFLALAAGATTVMKSNRSSYKNTIATNLAQDKVEELMATSIANIVAGPNETVPVDGINFTRRWAVTDNQPINGLKKIEVFITWTDNTIHNLTVTSAVDM